MADHVCHRRLENPNKKIVLIKRWNIAANNSEELLSQKPLEDTGLGRGPGVWGHFSQGMFANLKGPFTNPREGG